MAGFWKKIWRDLKKLIIFFFIFSLVGSLWYTAGKLGLFSRKPKFSAIIDADPANGIDDIFAISRALSDDRFEILGLSAAQCNYFPISSPGSVIASNQINDTLLRFYNNNTTLLKKGNPEMLFYEADASEAAEFIVEEAHKWSGKKKLNIIALGPLTNIASAVMLDSSIIPNIRVYAVTMKYDEGKKTWNKNEFNARNDMDALDLLLNKDELELHIMPANGAGELNIKKSEMISLMDHAGKQGLFYINKINSERQREVVSLPSVTLMGILLNPDLANEEQISSPPENNRHRIYVYNKINRNYIEVDFWNTFKDYAEKNWNN